MKPDRPFWKNCNARRLFLLVAFCVGVRNENLFANPTGMTVGSGSATAQQNGSQLNVTTSQLTLLNWSSFNIAAGETTTFLQPSVNSVVINEIGGASPSQIFGSLNANGTVILANANGFYFGPNSMISVGGSFIATTAPLTPDFGAGSAWTFTGMPPLASIVNYGQVKVGTGKSLYLIAEDVENHGNLSAPGGDVGLYAGQEVQLNERADGRGFSSVVRLPAGSVNNFGQITADAGTIALQAKVVNQDGLIQADSIRDVNGTIELIASDAVNLGADSVISAKGDNTGTSSGGAVTIKSENNFSDQAGSTINIAGGAQGGNGGQTEISAAQMSAIKSSINGQATAGFINGELTIDPTDITLDSAYVASLNSLINGGLSLVNLQADNNITISTLWTLPNSTTAANLNLTAGNNITFNNNSAISAGNNWTVGLVAGTGFIPTSAQPTPAAGSDEIFLDGNSYIQTQNGNINLFASGSVLVGNPNYFNPGIGSYINTAGGGNIYVKAQYGDINAGQNYTGYTIGNNGLKLGKNVGGISTLAGGNVTLDAGNDVISVPQTRTTSVTTPGASGAYGGGNVTVIAGNQITGNFLVSNGTGKLEAGVSVDGNNNVTVNNPNADIGTIQQGVNLSLISGNWQVFAARNLYVTEVNNPNGTFNANSIRVPANTFNGNIDSSGNITLPDPKQGNLFNYAPNAGASFWAGNAITVGNGQLFRFNGEADTTAIFPPILSLMAGVGGITLDSSIILYPSSQGSLNVEDGGNFTGVINNTVPTGITMSDSGLPDFTTFATGHAKTPLHSTDPNPVVFDVAGSIANLSLVVPTFADITVGGAQSFTAPNGQTIHGTYNFNFSGQNLASSGVGSTTSINVMGDIIYQGLITSISLNNYNAAPLPAEMFETAISTDPSVTQFLAYDATTGLLSYRGQMNSQGLAFLENPTVVVNGQTESISLTTSQKSALAALYAQSQGVQASGSGISLNGPGQFNITAQNMDLGTSAGIQVNQQFLSELFSATAINGALLNVNLSGNLEMTTTAIGNSGWLGGIQMNIGGTLDLGLQSLFGEPNNVARGIFTTSDGNISVTAVGDIDVDGSRIAAYDGGNVTVISQQGDVNAGSGGSGNVAINTELQLNADGTVTTLATGRNISGSGILALTDASSTIGVGNITVQALHGSINANLGGIEQVAFNNISSPDSFISLDAGKDISAGNSGVIGANIRTTAGGSISGIFVGSGAISVNAGANFSGTIVGSTSVSVNAGGSVSGTIVGGDNVSVSGGDITASLISGNVSTSGDAIGATVGIPQSNVAQSNAQTADNADAATSKNGTQDDEDDLKKKKSISLAQKVSRVTVILPPKIFSENQSSKNPL
jgi:filamentous hemagglutinin family protein